LQYQHKPPQPPETPQKKFFLHPRFLPFFLIMNLCSNIKPNHQPQGDFAVIITKRHSEGQKRDSFGYFGGFFVGQLFCLDFFGGGFSLLLLEKAPKF
jgi:hypothetical protein